MAAKLLLASVMGLLTGYANVALVVEVFAAFRIK
jgi:hypothetical protein